MVDQTPGDFVTPLLSEFNTKLRDIEEKQRLLKERVLIIGQNLVEFKDKAESQLTSLKLDMEEMKQDFGKIKSNLIRLTEELEKRARRSELEILEKQFKMFEPLGKK